MESRSRLLPLLPCAAAGPSPCPGHFRTSQLLPTHLLVRDLQQIQHHFVGIHVLQQALLLLAHLLSDPTHLIQPLQDLGREGPRQRGAEPGSPPEWPPGLGACLPSRCALHKPRCSLHHSQILAPPSEILLAKPRRQPLHPSPTLSPISPPSARLTREPWGCNRAPPCTELPGTSPGLDSFLLNHGRTWKSPS